jgi:hypothetical protein
MLITGAALGASINCAHVPDTLLAIRDLADREVVGCTGRAITAECG